MFIFFVFLCLGVQAQESDSYRYQRKIQYHYTVQDGDTLLFGVIPNITIFNPLVFKNNKEEIEYNKLIRDVRKTLPYAKAVTYSIIETYEYMQTLPDDKAKQKHLDQVKKYMMDEYKPKMKKLTRRQGQILIKLIDREASSTSYYIVKSIVGSFQAGMYNVFAGIFGNSLKTKYDPEGKDKLIERIAILIEEGVL
ncbi:DUF4294 domain-containing protein [Dysgonomonas sp. 520]|nr:DUF4294 domain-containing protein [Dysgonomonas sp. 520]